MAKHPEHHGLSIAMPLIHESIACRYESAKGDTSATVDMPSLDRMSMRGFFQYLYRSIKMTRAQSCNSCSQKAKSQTAKCNITHWPVAQDSKPQAAMSKNGPNLSPRHEFLDQFPPPCCERASFFLVMTGSEKMQSRVTQKFFHRSTMIRIRWHD